VRRKISVPPSLSISHSASRGESWLITSIGRSGEPLSIIALSSWRRLRQRSLLRTRRTALFISGTSRQKCLTPRISPLILAHPCTTEVREGFANMLVIGPFSRLPRSWPSRIAPKRSAVRKPHSVRSLHPTAAG
jgi:hypothetical protein